MFLRLAKIPYVLALDMGPNRVTGRWPTITLPEGTIVSDRQRIIEVLSRRYDVDLDAYLNSDQMATGVALRRVLESSTYHCLIRFRWVDNIEWLKSQMSFPVPSVLKSFVFWRIQRDTIRALSHHGNGDMTNREYHTVFLADLRYVANVLGDKKYLFGDTLTTFDCVAFGILSSMVLPEGQRCSAMEFVRDDPRLSAYVKRVSDEVFPDLKELTSPRLAGITQSNYSLQRALPALLLVGFSIVVLSLRYPFLSL